MATYIISDIHGEYEKLIQLLEKISFSEQDTLYVLGDVLDRGPNPIKVLLKMMEMPNIIPIAGNHEMMGLACLRFLMKEVTDENISELTEKMLELLREWQKNGSDTTMAEFLKLDKNAREDIIEYIEEFSTYEEVTINGTSYVLVHAGLGNFALDKPLYEYTLEELMWERADYEKTYFKDCYVITGHTPTQNIKNNPKPGYIYQTHNHIAIDCGACFGGRLAAYCLDTGEEFYV